MDFPFLIGVGETALVFDCLAVSFPAVLGVVCHLVLRRLLLKVRHFQLLLQGGSLIVGSFAFELSQIINDMVMLAFLGIVEGFFS